jgi:hypothetical protein
MELYLKIKKLINVVVDHLDEEEMINVVDDPVDEETKILV